MDGDYIVVYKFGYNGRIAHWSGIRHTRSEPDENGLLPESFTPQEIIPEDAQKVFLPASEGERFIRCNGKQHVVRDDIVSYDATLPEYRGYFELENALAALREEMAGNDYKQLKYMRGELSEEEFEEVKAWYAEKTSEYNATKEEMEIVRGEDAL